MAADKKVYIITPLLGAGAPFVATVELYGTLPGQPVDPDYGIPDTPRPPKPPGDGKPPYPAFPIAGWPGSGFPDKPGYPPTAEHPIVLPPIELPPINPPTEPPEGFPDAPPAGWNYTNDGWVYVTQPYPKPKPPGK